MRVLRVHKSIEPSLEQLKRMAANLRQRYGHASSVEVQAREYKLASSKVRYCIWIDNDILNSGVLEYREDWSEFQDLYFSLMNKEIK